MFHLAAFFKSLGDTANTQIPALNDGILSITNNNFLLPGPMQLLGATAMSVGHTRSYFSSPRINQYNPLYVRPLIQAVKPGDDPAIMDFCDRPLVLRGGEELALYGTTATTPGPENYTALVWLAERKPDLPAGEVWQVKYTSTTAATANAWSAVQITLGQNLPDGTYAMVMSEHQSSNAIAHRWTFSNQYFRPGFLSVTSLANRTYQGFYRLRFGQMGTFSTYNIPRLEVLCNGADATHEGYMSVVKLN